MSDSEEDESVYYGTPLQELDEEDIRSRKTPRIEDQFARDKQGRRRFHGAFTGGFSAGYFNSVGTKEGWTPSSFVSTSSQRAKSVQSQPQDFMDEEDLEAHGILPQGIQASANFDDSEQKKRKRVLDPSGPIPGTPVLEDILKPSRETMGMKLLRRLGWKPGQGVGPRINRLQKLSARKERERIYGCLRPEHAMKDSESENEEEEDLQDMTYAPDDVDTLHLTTPKTDHFGLGYKPLERSSLLGAHINLFEPSPLVMTEKKKKILIKGQAFGVGAFEDEDEDIYGTEDMSNYDFGEDKQESRRGQSNKDQTPVSIHGLIEVIEGFTLSSKTHQQHRVYPRPTMPKDFVPVHQPFKRRFERKESEMRGLGRHDMTAEQRARSITLQPKTTVEVRSGVKGKVHLPPRDYSKDVNTDEVDKIYEEFNISNAKFNSDFKPFMKDPEKQRRYDLFLRMKERSQEARFHLVQPKSMTEWQKQREVQELSRAAELFQPLTSTMANRFVSAATPDSGPLLKDGLNINIPKMDAATNDGNVDALGHNVTDERIKAAKMGMFGKLTQSVVEWHPDRLLCRRFNVPNPYPESSFVGINKSKREKFSIFNFLNAPVEETAGNRDVSPSPRDKERKETSEDEDLNTKPETFGLKVPVDGPPTMDLFKAIFQDSGSDSNSESEEEQPTSLRRQQESSLKSSHKLESSKAENSLGCLAKNISGSEMDSGDSRVVMSTSVDNSSEISRERKSVIDTVKDPVTAKRPDGQRVRISRFEPKKDDSTGDTEGLPKPLFINRRKISAATETTPAEGIFANIDFKELNSYRDTDIHATQDQTVNMTDRVKEGIIGSKKIDSDSSVDSEDEYGPPVPVHLKNRLQMIKSSSSTASAVVQTLETGHNMVTKQQSLWVEKESKRKSKKHKNKDKHKYKKEKKKKKDKKNKKQKEKKQKRKEHKNLSRKNRCSSDSDLSDSD